MQSIFFFPALTEGFLVWFWEGLLRASVKNKGDNNVVVVFKDALSPGSYHQTQRKAHRHSGSVANLGSWHLA